MKNQKYAICFHGFNGANYLHAVESHCYGDRLLGYYSSQRCCAMAFFSHDALIMLDKLRADHPVVLTDKGERLMELQVVPYPLPDQEVQHEN